MRAARIFAGLVPCLEDERGAVTCVHTRNGRELYRVTLATYGAVHGEGSVWARDEAADAAEILQSPWRLPRTPFETPAWVPEQALLVTIRVDAGCALTNGASVVCRVLAENAYSPRDVEPVRVPFDEAIVEIEVSSEPGPRLSDCCGATWPQDHHYCARLASGRVACWGANGVGQRGDGTREWATDARPAPGAPTLVHGIDDAVQIALGMHHACALHRTGHVSCWGYNLDGQLGDGTTETRLTPVRVLAVEDVVAVQAADAHTCALRRDGRVLCWGDPRSYGQIAHALDEGAWVRFLALPEPVEQVVAAARYTCARSASGRVYCGGSM